MTPSQSQCDPRQLRQLLDDKLPPESQDKLAKHLESCPDCRKELESLAAGPDWWDDAQQILSTIINFDSATSADNAASVIRVRNENTEGLRLGFLSPSDDPTKLGRLGPYEIIKVIGRGGMGIVLKGFDSALNRHVAIKVLSPQWMHSDAARRRFAREAKAAAAVVHEHVIAIYAVDSANEMPYLVMPFIDGISLQQRIDRACATGASATGASATGYASVNGPLELKEILRISIQIASGLAAAHAQNLVHRDIKPANILLENCVERVLITDFGLARAVDDASFTRSCFIAGTPEYMAPEQAEGEAVDHRIDLFSLGSVMYALCTGQSPFRRETTMAVLRQICEGTTRPIRQINPNIPLWLEQIINKLHAKNPADRFQSAAETAELLKGWLNHIEKPSLHPRPQYPSKKWFGVSRYSKSITIRAIWAAASAVLILIAALAATEFAGKTHLLRRTDSGQESVAVVKPNTPRAKINGEEPDTAGDAAFSNRIADLWQQVSELKTAQSAGDSDSPPPNVLDGVRSQLAELQAELPEYRRSAEIERLKQIAAVIEQLKQPASQSETGGVDARLLEFNARIEQLNQELYRIFP
jgi:eukaryotic-like serine/threonine-protein kinase